MSFLYSLAVVAMQVAAPQAAPPAPATLTMQQQTALRCSVAIAMGAERQRAGGGEADWPDLTERGREFFVRSLAQLMDDTGMSREALMQAAAGEAAEMKDGKTLQQVMPACLLMLNASGL